MRPKSSYSEKRFELSSIYEDLRGMASELNLATWTVSQVNRSGYNKRIITVDNIAEDFNKSTICDFIMSIGRDINDRRGGAAQVFVAKNRRGRDAVEFDMDMKFDTGKITIQGDAHEILNEQTFKEKRPDIADDDAMIDNLLESLK
jgi:replicative DNA helicase